ncbi:hypothetical protein VTO42DRAFT_6267 [Malbranchea cinnamomea]
MESSQELDTADKLLYSPNGLTRWYIDTRGLTATTSDLPLLSTLQPSDQKSIQKYYRLADRHMSLASYLLKYLFIHQTCRVPWSEVVISRTPAPHQRPCYIPVQRGDAKEKVTNIEFNVSHQASMVALAGCIIPPDIPLSTSPSISPNPSPQGPASIPQVGIDITCTNERERRNKDSIPKTEKELYEFIDIFSEVFSAREISNMKAPLCASAASTPSALDAEQSLARSIHDRLRCFYTYWALKEAYIKMTGEALLAPWLRELEFLDVVAPSPPSATNSISASGGTMIFGTPYTRTKILLHGQEVQDVRMEVVALGEEYLFATAARGKGMGKHPDADESSNDPWTSFKALDIERDIAPCARGECHCLEK